MSEVAQENISEEVQVAEEAVASRYTTVLEKFQELIQEITNCDDDQAANVGLLLSSMIGEAIDHVINDTNTLQAIFTNMMRVQLNNNVRLENIIAAQSRQEYIVIDEPHPTSDLRVQYVGEEASSWVFEQADVGGWKELALQPQQRLNLEALAGKFFNGRVGHIGYVVEVGAMNSFDASNAQ